MARGKRKSFGAEETSKVSPPDPNWIPKTDLGKLVLNRDITSMEEVITQNFVLKEPEITKHLIPNLEYDVIEVKLVQKQTDAGEKSRFRATVIVGNKDGWIGIGTNKAPQVHKAIEKALNKSLLTLFPVRRGCGSWECGCTLNHSVRVISAGHWGNVKIQILPGPRGLGIVAAETAKSVIKLAGVTDCWVKTFGETRTVDNFAHATYTALKNSYSLITKEAWIR